MYLTLSNYILKIWKHKKKHKKYSCYKPINVDAGYIGTIK